MTSQMLEPSDDLAIMAHELRTPMATLRLLSETLVERCPDSPTLRRLGDQIRCISGTLTDTLESCLDPLRFKRGSVHWCSCDLRDIAHAAIGTVRPLLISSPVRVVGPVGQGVEMRGDAEALRRLLVNLLANAVRHVSMGGVYLTLDKVRRRRLWNVIEVADTGMGMDAATLRRVASCEPSAETGGMRGQLGTGLGLRICRSIAAAHGGWMEMASRTGEGTTVRVFLRADLQEVRARFAPRQIRVRA
jgi:signal transduction histidine kinase